MISALKRRLQVSYAAFTSARNTLVAQVVIIVLAGALTIVSMSGIARHENKSTTADWMR